MVIYQILSKTMSNHCSSFTNTTILLPAQRIPANSPRNHQRKLSLLVITASSSAQEPQNLTCRRQIMTTVLATSLPGFGNGTPLALAENFGSRSFLKEPGLSQEDAATRIKHTAEGLHSIEEMLEPKAWSNSNDERPRHFDSKAKSMCWAKADVVPGRHPDRWRKDAAGNIVCKRFCNCKGCLCFEYDHIVPFSKGGESTVDNCQILQTRVNRLKSDKELADTTRLKDYSCDIKFTDKELDIIEMAVYGDVIRPGKECRCKTVAEMLGQYKSRDKIAACKLP